MPDEFSIKLVGQPNQIRRFKIENAVITRSNRTKWNAESFNLFTLIKDKMEIQLLIKFILVVSKSLLVFSFIALLSPKLMPKSIE